MKKFVGFLFFAAIPYLAHTAHLLPAEHFSCVNAAYTAFDASCGEESDFYIDQNGKCGCFFKADMLAADICINTDVACNEADGQTFSSLYQYRHDESGLIEITYAGCGCSSSATGLHKAQSRPNTFKQAMVKKSLSTPLQNSVTVACFVDDLKAAIADANLHISTTLILASNCSYIIDTPSSMNEALPTITSDITIEGGEKTIIARDQSAAAFRIITVDNGATLTLKNLGIENGNTPGLGGAILNNGNLVLENIIFSNNIAANGGSISTSIGAITSVVSSEFFANNTTGVGGSGLINFGTTTINNSRFYGNSGPINGGAINTQPGGITTASASFFSHNTSGSLGGALSNLGTLTIDHSQIQNNTGSSGGAIATGNLDVTLFLNKIINNSPDNCSPLNTISGCVN